MSIIQPRTLKGFRDLTPQQARLRADLVRTLEDVFRAHGYGPIDTPALEYAEILKGKGADVDKELFEFTDKGGREVAMRFDLTVPLARYVAQHQGTLAFPFRRYHLGPVWRGERPQRGRYREFWQCDADIVGPVTAEADAEILVLMLSAYEALDVGTVTLRINDRRVLSGLLEQLGTSTGSLEVLRAIDKREKQGDDAVRKELSAAGMSDADIERVLDVCAPRRDDETTLAMLREAVGDSETGVAGVDGLERVRALVEAAGKPLSSLRVDPSIARGLDYYTGVVLEAQLDDLPDIGSVGSGRAVRRPCGALHQEQLAGRRVFDRHRSPPDGAGRARSGERGGRRERHGRQRRSGHDRGRVRIRRDAARRGARGGRVSGGAQTRRADEVRGPARHRVRLHTRRGRVLLREATRRRSVRAVRRRRRGVGLDPEPGPLTDWRNQEPRPILCQLQAGKHAICACGKTGNKPFCDGSHKGTGNSPHILDVDPMGQTVAWCTCRTSGRMPFCDGSHKKLWPIQPPPKDPK